MGLCILESSLNFSASGGWDKEKKEPAEKIAVGNEGATEGGEGEFRLARAEAKPRRPARSEQSSAKWT